MRESAVEVEVVEVPQDSGEQERGVVPLEAVFAEWEQGVKFVRKLRGCYKFEWRILHRIVGIVRGNCERC